MAVPTGTQQTYQIVGDREDLTDILSNISPTDTPFLTMAGTATATNTYHEWQTDSLRAGQSNKQLDGDDATIVASSPTVRLGNYTQIYSESASVAGSVEKQNRAGRAAEMAYQVGKRMKELKLDREFQYVGSNVNRDAGAAGTARESASVTAWITTNTSKGGSGVDPTGDGTDARTDGTQRVFTEALLTATLELCWTSGADVSTLMVNSFQKTKIGGFSGNADTIYHQNNDKKVVASVTIYEGDYHTLKVVPNRFMRQRDALILDPSMWKIANYRPIHTYDLAKTGDSEKKQILLEETLVCVNPDGNGIVADLTTS